MEDAIEPDTRENRGPDISDIEKRAIIKAI